MQVTENTLLQPGLGAVILKKKYFDSLKWFCKITGIQREKSCFNRVNGVCQVKYAE